MSGMSERSGYSMPRPVFLDLQDPASMASWLARRVETRQEHVARPRLVDCLAIGERDRIGDDDGGRIDPPHVLDELAVVDAAQQIVGHRQHHLISSLNVRFISSLF